MRKYRKKSAVIDAVQLTWANWSEVCEFANVGKVENGKASGCYIDKYMRPSDQPGGGPRDKIGMYIPTLEGLMVAVEGDWIIKGVKGEIYPCKKEIFEAKYEKA